MQAIKAPSNIELPMGDIAEPIIDNDGQVIVASHFYQRVQEYESSGSYICGWQVPNKFSRLQFLSPDTLQINDKTYKTCAPSLSKNDSSRIRFCNYEGGLHSRIVCPADNNRPESILERPVYFWFLNGLHAWFMGALGLLLAKAMKQKIQKEKKKNILTFKP
jgi:hypothetical protein